MTANRLPRLLMWNIRPIQIAGRITWMGMFAGANGALVAAPSKWLTGWPFYVFFAVWVTVLIVTEASIDIDHPVKRKPAVDWPSDGPITFAKFLIAIGSGGLTQVIAGYMLPPAFSIPMGGVVMFGLLSVFQVVAWVKRA